MLLHVTLFFCFWYKDVRLTQECLRLFTCACLTARLICVVFKIRSFIIFPHIFVIFTLSYVAAMLCKPFTECARHQFLNIAQFLNICVFVFACQMIELILRMFIENRKFGFWF